MERFIPPSQANNDHSNHSSSHAHHPLPHTQMTPTGMPAQQQQQHSYQQQTSMPLHSSNDPDTKVVEAINRLGTNLNGQLSSLSTQLASLLSLMSQLVEQSRHQQPVGMAHTTTSMMSDQSHQAGPSSTWVQHQQQPSVGSHLHHPHHHAHAAPFQQAPHATNDFASSSSVNASSRPPVYRRDSGHPFAFDPASDVAPIEQTASGSREGPFSSQEATDQMGNGLQHQSGSHMGLLQQQQHQMGPPLPPLPPAMDSSGDDGHLSAVGNVGLYPDHHHHHHQRLPSHQERPLSGNGMPQDPGSLSNAMTFEGSGSGQHSPAVPMAQGQGSPSRRPGSSYGSVRPFTAVDHSSRPTAMSMSGSFGSAQNHINGGFPHQQATQDVEGNRGNAKAVGFALIDQSNNEQGLQSSADQPEAQGRFGAVRNGNSVAYTTAYDLRNGSIDHAVASSSSSSSHPARALVHRPAVYFENTTSSDSGFQQSAGSMSSYCPATSPGAGIKQGSPVNGTLQQSDSDFHTDSPYRKRLSRPSDAVSAGQGHPHKRREGGGRTSPSPSESPSVHRPMGDYRYWAFTPPTNANGVFDALPEPRWRTLSAARVDLQRKTGRTMAKLGRLPLKDYLEVDGGEYLAARKAGRSAYQEWLDPLVRLAKQDADRVKACTNFIEFHHPMLAKCEGSYKARQLLQQIIDNAIDESTSKEKQVNGGNLAVGGRETYGSGRGGDEE